jgi:hypothetical protein
MTEPDDKAHRRRRRPHQQPAPEGSAAGAAARQAKGSRDGTDRSNTAKGGRGGEQGRSESAKGGRDSERGWRELAGTSPSQVGPSGALRARDVARPTAEDLAAAEQSVTVVRRHWQPPPTEG